MNRVLVLLFVAFMLSGPVHAQPPNRSTAIAGVVNDATGAAIVGAPSKFDDDLNTPSRVLPKYAVVNLSVSSFVGRRPTWSAKSV